MLLVYKIILSYSALITDQYPHYQILTKNMYNNLYGFLIINNDIYDLIFGSINTHSTSHALTHLLTK